MLQSSIGELENDQLVALFREGNKLAFTEIYNRYWKKLFNYTYNILNDRDLAEDVLQDVFTRVWDIRERTEIHNLKAYLFNACRNNAISKIRQARLTKFQEEMIESLSLRPEAEINLDFDDLRQTIDKAAEGLPDRCREIFYMSRIQHLSIQEIAEKLNISHRTVENQLGIALKHLRLSLSDPLFLIASIAIFG